MFVNARLVKNLPGRKTDVSDAAWLAQLGAHGLVRDSFVPHEPIRQLRDLTRTRTTIIRERTREIQCLEKLMEDTGVNLSSVTTEMNGVSSRIFLDALEAGEHDPSIVDDMAKSRFREKIPELMNGLAGRFSEHHAFLVQIQLGLIDQRAEAINEIAARIEVVMDSFRTARDLISTIPGISTKVADVTIAETGADMGRFPTASHLTRWAGVSGIGRVRGSGDVDAQSSGQSLPQGRPRDYCHERGTLSQHLLRGQVSADRLISRTRQGHGGHRTRHAHNGLYVHEKAAIGNPHTLGCFQTRRSLSYDSCESQILLLPVVLDRRTRTIPGL